MSVIDLTPRQAAGTAQNEGHRESELSTRRRRSPILAVVITAVAQGLLAAAIALGGDPLVGAVAAIALTACGVMTVLAASLQS